MRRSSDYPRIRILGPAIAGGFVGEHNVFLISSHDARTRSASDGFARRGAARTGGITVEIARRKRKLADAKESRQWADGVVSTSARSEGKRGTVLLCSAIRE